MNDLQKIVDEMRREIARTVNGSIRIPLVQSWIDAIATHSDCVPLKGPPDKYARTVDGVLLAVGDTVYFDDCGSDVVAGLERVMANLNNNGYVRYAALLSAPPAPPVTAESALRELLDALEPAHITLYSDDSIRLDRAREAARQVLAQQPIEFTCPKCNRGSLHLNPSGNYVCLSLCCWSGTEAEFRAACQAKVSQ